MALRDLFVSSDGKPKLYRQAWSETSDPLVAEARSQTLAIQRLQLWLRLAYSALALAALLAYWGFTDGHSIVLGVVGSVLGSLALGVVMVLRTGIRNGRNNVEAMLRALEAKREHGSKQ